VPVGQFLESETDLDQELKLVDLSVRLAPAAPRGRRPSTWSLADLFFDLADQAVAGVGDDAGGLVGESGGPA
jgi:hypothetical protein